MYLATLFHIVQEALFFHISPELSSNEDSIFSKEN